MSIELENLRQGFLINFDSAQKRLEKSTKTEEAGQVMVDALLVNPSGETKITAFEYCQAFGCAKLTGANVPGGVINPLIAYCAMPMLNEWLERLKGHAQNLGMPRILKDTLKPSSAKETLAFITEVMNAIGAYHAVDLVHLALHDGSVKPADFSDIPAEKWNVTWYCEQMQKVQQALVSLYEIMSTKKDTISAVYDTPLVKAWTEGLKSAGYPAQWWLVPPASATSPAGESKPENKFPFQGFNPLLN